MITPLTVHDGICDFLEEKVAPKFSLKTTDRNGKESRKSPQVIRSGWILPKSLDVVIPPGEDDEASFFGEEIPPDDGNFQDEEFPYIIPRIVKVENNPNERETILILQVYFGVYDPGTIDGSGNLVNDGSGYRDFWNLVEATRQAFFTEQTIDRIASLDSNFFEAEPLEEQTYPYWEGWLKTKWKVALPQPKIDHTLL